MPIYLTKLTQEETDNVNIPKYMKEIDFVVKILQTKKTPGPDSFTGKF